MRKFTQALIIAVGFTVAIATVKAERPKPSLGNCFEIAAPSAPTVCN